MANRIGIDLGGTKIKLNIEDKNKLDLIENNETEFDDSSLLFIEEGIETTKYAVKKGIDNDAITGLFAHKPLSDGYTGFYNYHPKEKIYMTGKVLTSESKPVGKSLTSSKNKLNLTKIFNKKIQQIKPTAVKIETVKTKAKPTTKKQKVKKTTKGGKY